MEKVIRRFSNHAKADRYEHMAYSHLSPRQCVELLETLRRQYEKIKHARQQRFRRVLKITQRG
jgi:hypothetical protein